MRPGRFRPVVVRCRGPINDRGSGCGLLGEGLGLAKNRNSAGSLTGIVDGTLLAARVDPPCAPDVSVELEIGTIVKNQEDLVLRSYSIVFGDDDGLDRFANNLVNRTPHLSLPTVLVARRVAGLRERTLRDFSPCTKISCKVEKISVI